MLQNKSFKKQCMVFCPRAIQQQARKSGHINNLETDGCEIYSDCYTYFTSLTDKKDFNSVTTNNIKGAYYLKNSNGVEVNLKSFSEIVRDETKRQ